jgi:hypothetical protein
MSTEQYIPQIGETVRRKTGGVVGTVQRIYRENRYGLAPVSGWRVEVLWQGNVRYISGRRDQKSTILLREVQPAAAQTKGPRKFPVVGTYHAFTNLSGTRRECAVKAWGAGYRTFCGWPISDNQPERFTLGGTIDAVTCKDCCTLTGGK